MEQGVVRYDVGSLRSPKKLANGWLRLDGYIGRAGVLEYRRADGTIRRELVRDTVAFDKESMASFELVPLTRRHPSELLTAQNTNEHTIGTVGNVRRDGNFKRADILMTDAQAIAELGEASELSCGYTCDFDPTPGEYNGQRYDGEQLNRQGNHVAVVAKGRAGPDARLRTDSSDAVMIPPRAEEHLDMEENILIGGITFKVSPQVAQAITKERADAATVQDELTKQVKVARADADKASARADQAATELKTRSDVADKMPELVRARVALERKASVVLGEKVKLDGMEDKAVKLAVITKLAPECKLDGKSDDYIDARYDGVVEQFDKKNPGLARTRADAFPPVKGKKPLFGKDPKEGDDEEEDDEEEPESEDAARAAMMKRNAGKK